MKLFWRRASRHFIIYHAIQGKMLRKDFIFQKIFLYLLTNFRTFVAFSMIEPFWKGAAIGINCINYL
jgi:hypothetical protein